MNANAQILRGAATVFALALLLHGADHVRRGIEIPSRLSIGGGLQFLLGLVAVVLVFRGHRWAPGAAAVVGFGSAALFISAHLLPQGTDPYTGANPAAGVTAFSWLTAVFEIGADLVLGWAGVAALRGRPGLATAAGAQ